jgi:hypothetical protein
MPDSYHVVTPLADEWGDTPRAVHALIAKYMQRPRPLDCPDWDGYSVDEAALRHGAGVEQETTDQKQAYARFPKREPTRYREGWLPG